MRVIQISFVDYWPLCENHLRGHPSRFHYSANHQYETLLCSKTTLIRRGRWQLTSMNSLARSTEPIRTYCRSRMSVFQKSRRSQIWIERSMTTWEDQRPTSPGSLES